MAPNEEAIRSVLAELSHDLGTPLTAMTTSLFLMQTRLGQMGGAAAGEGFLQDVCQLHEQALGEAERMRLVLRSLRARGRAGGVIQPSPSSRMVMHTPPMGDSRFDRAWDEWDSARLEGRTQSTLLHDATVEDLVHLLAAQVGRDRAVERNIIATALLNRLGPPDARARSEASSTREDVWDLVVKSARLSQQGHALAERTHALVEAQRASNPRTASRKILPAASASKPT